MNENRQTSSVEIVDYTFVCASREGGATSKVVIPVPVYGDITEAALKGVIDRYIQLHHDMPYASGLQSVAQLNFIYVLVPFILVHEAVPA